MTEKWFHEVHLWQIAYTEAAKSRHIMAVYIHEEYKNISPHIIAAKNDALIIAGYAPGFIGVYVQLLWDLLSLLC